MSRNVAIVGATGAVGQELLSILAQRKFPMDSLKLLASKNSAGKKQTFNGKELTIEELTHDSFKGIDIEFKRRSNGEISNMSTITSMVIQAIKAIGKDRITEDQIDSLKKRLSSEEKKALLREGKAATAWIYEILRKIGREDE